MLNYKVDYTFNFVYMKNATITMYSPENIWFHAPD